MLEIEPVLLMLAIALLAVGALGPIVDGLCRCRRDGTRWCGCRNRSERLGHGHLGEVERRPERYVVASFLKVVGLRVVPEPLDMEDQDSRQLLDAAKAKNII